MGHERRRDEKLHVDWEYVTYFLPFISSISFSFDFEMRWMAIEAQEPTDLCAGHRQDQLRK